MSQSVGRALRLLVELDHGGRSLDDLAGRLDVHKTTVLRLLRTLEEDRFVRRDDAHRYFLGSRLFELGRAALEEYAVADVARPHLRRLAEDTGGQAVHLAVLERHEPVYVAKVESTSAVRMYSQVGRPAPLHATAVGKVLASELPPGRLAEVLDATDFAPLTEHTITDPGAYRDELARVRRQGWAEDAAEHEAFVDCVGAPVRAGDGAVIAAVSISVPVVNLDLDGVRRLVPRLLETTAAIEADWAGGPRPPDSAAIRTEPIPDERTST